jgi:hypothetical protein
MHFWVCPFLPPPHAHRWWPCCWRTRLMCMRCRTRRCARLRTRTSSRSCWRQASGTPGHAFSPCYCLLCIVHATVHHQGPVGSRRTLCWFAVGACPVLLIICSPSCSSIFGQGACPVLLTSAFHRAHPFSASCLPAMSYCLLSTTDHHPFHHPCCCPNCADTIPDRHHYHHPCCCPNCAESLPRRC